MATCGSAREIRSRSWLATLPSNLGGGVRRQIAYRSADDDHPIEDRADAPTLINTQCSRELLAPYLRVQKTSRWLQSMIRYCLRAIQLQRSPAMISLKDRTAIINPRTKLLRTKSLSRKQAMSRSIKLRQSHRLCGPYAICSLSSYYSRSLSPCLSPKVLVTDGKVLEMIHQLIHRQLKLESAGYCLTTH